MKKDKLDAAECYVPNNKIMGLRELVRHRIVADTESKLKNSIHGIMLMKGYLTPVQIHLLWSI